MIGNRLKEERERLGLTQPAFAEAASAKKRTLIDWEKNVSSPTAVQLSALSAVGVDISYVLTGVRTSVYEKITKDLSEANEQFRYLRSLAEEKGVSTVGPEKELLDLFKAATDQGKEAIIATARAVEKNKEKPNG